MFYLIIRPMQTQGLCNTVSETEIQMNTWVNKKILNILTGCCFFSFFILAFANTAASSSSWAQILAMLDLKNSFFYKTKKCVKSASDEHIIWLFPFIVSAMYKKAPEVLLNHRFEHDCIIDNLNK